MLAVDYRYIQRGHTCRAARTLPVLGEALDKRQPGNTHTLPAPALCEKVEQLGSDTLLLELFALAARGFGGNLAYGHASNNLRVVEADGKNG